MTWAEIVAELRRAERIADGEDDWCGLVYAGERKQRVALKHGFDRKTLVIIAQVCATRHLSARDALAFNNVAEGAALAVEGHVYVLRQPFPLAALSMAALDALIDALVDQATRVRLRCESAVRLSDGGATLFAHWCG